MNRRTFETLAKYIAEQSKVQVMFDHPGEGACANPLTGEIHMPGEIAGHNALAALALLMHEAAHIRWSKSIPIKFMQDPIKKDIVNAIEDARIDVKNFGRLLNVKGFYERMYRDHKKPDPKLLPVAIKVLLNQILNYEGCAKWNFKDGETKAWEAIPEQGQKLTQHFCQGIWAIDAGAWNDLDREVGEIIKLLKIDRPLSKMISPDLVLEAACAPAKTGNKPGQEGKGVVGQGNGAGAGAGDGKDGKDVVGLGTDNNIYDHIDVIDAILHPKSILAKGSMDGNRGDQIGPAALQEQTRQKFKELLNMKTKHIVADGGILDVDSLTSYHTGDIETLFKEEMIKHEKKSKITILMDCSGSMGAPLIDNKSRKSALVACVKAVTDILDEVIELEGINVDYDMAAFSCDYYKLTKEDWVKEFMRLSGGTDFHMAFHQAITDLANDNSIDGKKMIVCFTDGDVHETQIVDVYNDIIKYGSDVRAMVIGIGTDPCSKMSQDIVGDRIILAQENADLILLETIGEML